MHFFIVENNFLKTPQYLNDFVWNLLYFYFKESEKPHIDREK